MKSGYIAIVGRPNAGKSTLLNRVCGSNLSIVTPKAQTTRERVLGILTEKDIGQIVFVDTPGIHRAKEGGINEFMVGEAKRAMEETDLVWYLVDPYSSVEYEAIVLDMIEKSKAPVAVLLNKSDMKMKGTSKEIENARTILSSALEKEILKRGIPLAGIFPISAVRGAGVPELMKLTWDRLPEGPLYYNDVDQLSDRPTKFFVAEKVREQFFHQLGEELPYSCGVEIDRFDEKTKPLRIEATIFVERDSQKGMVIGKGGQKIKQIGTAARMEIEEFLGQQVFLGLKVKVLPKWTEDLSVLERLGYSNGK